MGPVALVPLALPALALLRTSNTLRHFPSDARRWVGNMRYKLSRRLVVGWIAQFQSARPNGFQPGGTSEACPVASWRSWRCAFLRCRPARSFTKPLLSFMPMVILTETVAQT